MWLFYMIIGTIFVLFCDILYSKWDISLKHILYIIPLVFLSNIFYWIAFQKGPSFLIVWLIGTGCISIIAFIYSIYFDNQIINIKFVIGSILILIGSFLLNLK